MCNPAEKNYSYSRNGIDLNSVLLFIGNILLVLRLTVVESVAGILQCLQPDLITGEVMRVATAPESVVEQ